LGGRVNQWSDKEIKNSTAALDIKTNNIHIGCFLKILTYVTPNVSMMLLHGLPSLPHWTSIRKKNVIVPHLPNLVSNQGHPFLTIPIERECIDKYQIVSFYSFGCEYFEISYHFKIESHIPPM